ncbi:hypothetical protein, partial [Stenotrophomonas sp. 3diitr2024]|uniref:hypothetical protein n=1 Tax=Stenotrophomonas sp. 3diitr2024 TaxID=3345115 RepID=UPI0035CBBBFF
GLFDLARALVLLDAVAGEDLHVDDGAVHARRRFSPLFKAVAIGLEPGRGALAPWTSVQFSATPPCTPACC